MSAEGFAVDLFRLDVTDVVRSRYFLDHEVACCTIVSWIPT